MQTFLRKIEGLKKKYNMINFCYEICKKGNVKVRRKLYFRQVRIFDVYFYHSNPFSE